MGKRILALILMAVMMLTMGAQAVDTFAVKDTIAKYMVDNGYATAESYLDTNAGNFATKPGHSVLVTINNTVDVCYTAHNTNRKDAAFTNTELNSTYTFYVIKNY
ncbi:hypothetical protein [Dysosmobacter sp.]|uniref:hypothetical protein n=1 Tax=Dysosmobacter sp. TaxID=2591382 RepID=UPI0026731DCC|nr:hypothetical protein [Dysosmobacter sp.]MCI7281440.1 hypothetical protein [Dysosmobacter sp.]